MKKLLFKKYYAHLLENENRVLSVETKQGFFIGTTKFLMNVAIDKTLGFYPFNEAFTEETPELSKLIDIEKVETEPIIPCNTEKYNSNKNIRKFRHESGIEIFVNEKLIKLIPYKDIHFKVSSTGGVNCNSPILVFDSSDDLIAYIAPEHQKEGN